LEGGVEPLDAAALMVPTARAGEGPEPEPADFIVAFIPTAPRSAVFTMDFVVASSAIVFTVASSATIFFYGLLGHLRCHDLLNCL
jgi:hypothetical protein